MRPAPAERGGHRRPSLIAFDTAGIFAMLEARSAPVTEAEILRLLTGGERPSFRA